MFKFNLDVYMYRILVDKMLLFNIDCTLFLKRTAQRSSYHILLPRPDLRRAISCFVSDSSKLIVGVLWTVMD